MIFTSIQKTFWPENQSVPLFLEDSKVNFKRSILWRPQLRTASQEDWRRIVLPRYLNMVDTKFSIFRERRGGEVNIYNLKGYLFSTKLSWGYTNARLNQMILLSPKTLELLSKIDLIKWRSRFLKKTTTVGQKASEFFTEMAKTFYESCLCCQASRATITGQLLPQLKEQEKAAGSPGRLCLDSIMLWISGYRLAVIDEPKATTEHNKCTALRSLGEAHRMLRID